MTTLRSTQAHWTLAATLVASVVFSACTEADIVVGGGEGLPTPRLLATAVQDGPVAFRDPVGVISPDGQWLAYTEHRRIVVMPVAGGEPRILGEGAREPRDLVWFLDSSALIAAERTYDRSDQTWFRYDLATSERSTWLDGFSIPIQPQQGDTLIRDLRPNGLLDVAFVPGIEGGLGIERRPEGDRLWGWRNDFNQADWYRRGGRLQYPRRVTQNRGLACLASESGEPPHLELPCGPARSARTLTDVEVAYGPYAFSPLGLTVYFAAPDARGMLQLWRRTIEGGEPVLLATHIRDAYAPSTTDDGRVVYKTQEYTVTLATAPAEGGASTALTTFQSETPTWSPDGQRVAFTFGDWRRAVDDFRYPDISQHIGMVEVSGARPIAEPSDVFRQSDSEDQGLSWSPDGRFVAFHSHADGGDDIYIQRADRSEAAVRVSEDGQETGWPRWSRNGRSILYPSYTLLEGGARRSALFLLDVDPATGRTSGPPQRIQMDFQGDALQADWLDAGNQIVFEGASAFGEKALYRVGRSGGVPQLIHRFKTDQLHSGLAASPDGRWIAFVAPDAEGYYQIYRVPAPGGQAQALTSDPTHKTQPAYDPTGKSIAFAVFDYRAQFWMLDP